MIAKTSKPTCFLQTPSEIDYFILSKNLRTRIKTLDVENLDRNIYNNDH